MLFNSLAFLAFLPIVFLLYWFVCSRTLRSQNMLVLLASYFFYGWWSWKFLSLLAASTLLDFIYGFQVASPNRKRARFFLWLSVVNNLGILAVFKYYNFFATQLHDLLGHFGLHTNLVLLNVALPIGISFYTFHGMSYVFDIYRGKQKPVSNFIDYAVFVSFFPLLVAGPIERANHLLPQVRQRRVFNYNQSIEGCRLILWGMVKKVVIADSLAVIVNHTFDHYSSLTGISLLLGAIAFSFQIYGDFSGYSDIALGTAKLFGFELLSNFKFPYFSRDIAEFWRRWHISLSSWFRDYLYIPLGGSKQGKAKAVRNTFIIFLVSGFWHGASWNFIVWGGIHACLFLPLLLRGKNRKHVGEVVAEHRRLPNFREVRQMLTTFAFVTLAWVFFRAHGLSQAVDYLRDMVVSIVRHPGQIMFVPEELTAFFYIVPMVAIDWAFRRDERRLNLGIRLSLPQPVRFALYNCLILLVAWYMIKGTSQQFIYFQF